MQLSSPAFAYGELIPKKYTCDGDNTSPPLTIAGVPSKALSLVLVVDDPDAPVGDWVHWLVWNLDPHLTTIEGGRLPVGAVEGLNDFGNQNYGGPCPPSGSHRYQFTLFALDTSLDLSNRTEKKALLEALNGHILDQVQLVGRYHRQ